MNDARLFDGRLVLPPEFWLLFSRRRTIGVCVCLGLLLGLIVVMARSDVYASNASLMIENRRLVFGAEGAVLTEPALTDGLIDSQIEQLRSDMVGLRVVSALNLADDPEFAPQEPPLARRLLARIGLGEAERLDAEVRARAALRHYKQSLSVDRIGMTYVATLRFRSGDPTKAAEVLDATIAEYLAVRAAANEKIAQGATAWLRDRARTTGPTASVLTPPAPPAFPSGLSGKAIIVAFGMLGLLAGLGVALVQSLTDRRVRSASHLAERTGAPCYGELPITTARPVTRAALDPAEASFAAPIELAVSSLLAADSIGTVGVCSAVPQEGKTAVAVNLAALLAQASGKRTLLVDAARGAGPVAEADRRTGLSGIVQDYLPGVDLLQFDPDASGAAAVVFWRRTATDTLAELRGSYEAIVVDLPANAASIALRQAAPLLDSILLIVSEETSGGPEFAALLELPELRDRLRGTILNRHSLRRGHLNVLWSRLYHAPELEPATTEAAARDPASIAGGKMQKVAGGSGIMIALALLGSLVADRTEAASYRLFPSDHVQVEALEFPQVTGEFVIDADGALALPMIGEIYAAGLTPPELAKRIAETLRVLNRLDVAPATSARITQYRPVYVLGDVERPGVYPFTPQIVVVEALAQAGGAFRSDSGQLRNAIGDFGMAERLEAERARVLVSLARFRAEMADAEMIDYPMATLSQADRAQVAAMIDQENALFQARRDVTAERVSTLARLQELYRGEIDTIDKQIALKKRQIETYALERSRLSRSSMPSARALELERAQADAESELLELVALQQRARQMLAQAEQDSAMVLGNRRTQATEGFSKSSADLAGIESDLRTSRRQLARFAEVEADRGQEDLRFTILRRDLTGALTNLDASEVTPLEPGDVLKAVRVVDGTGLN